MLSMLKKLIWPEAAPAKPLPVKEEAPKVPLIWLPPPKILILDKSPEWVFTAPPALDWDVFTALKIKDLLLALASVMDEKPYLEAEAYIQKVLQVHEPGQKGCAMHAVYKCLKDNDILIQYCLTRGWELALPNNKVLTIPTTSEVNLT